MKLVKCYKFEVKTDLEPADMEDLKRASKQGSLLRIKVNGTVYGSGGFNSSPEYSSLKLTGILLGMGMLIGGVILFMLRRQLLRRKLLKLPPSFHESLQNECHDIVKDPNGGKQGAGFPFMLANDRFQFLQWKLPPSIHDSIQSASQYGDGIQKESQDDPAVGGVLSLFAFIRRQFLQRQLLEAPPSMELAPSIRENQSDNSQEARPID